MEKAVVLGFGVNRQSASDALSGGLGGWVELAAPPGAAADWLPSRDSWR